MHTLTEENVPFESILQDARFAPSGDNIQPWLVKIIARNKLVVFKNQPENIEESDYFRGGGYCGVGAFIEAIVIAARHYGFLVSVKYTEDLSPETARIASLLFVSQHDPAFREEESGLYAALTERRTDRRRYATDPLPLDVKQRITDCAIRSGGRVIFVDDRSTLVKMSRIFSRHDDFFWEDALGRDNLIRTIHGRNTSGKVRFGMSIDALGLGYKTPFLLFSFRLAYYFPWLWKIIGWQSRRTSEQLMQSSSALVLVTLPKRRVAKMHEVQYDFRDDLEGGRIGMRLWLLAASFGMAIQPTYALVAQMQNEGNASQGEYFLALNQEIVADMRSCVPELTHETLVFAFRIGRPLASQLAPLSPRKTIDEIIWHTEEGVTENTVV